MSAAPAIELRGVWKSFPRQKGHRLLRSHAADWLRRRAADRFFALKNISLQVCWGQSVGVVGANGAGKSTLLGLLAGLTLPDRGRVVVRGRAAALLELGSGFHPDLTGAENLRLNAALVGLSRRRTEELFNAIVEFSEIGDFIDEPLRSYSSGMVMRLAFSVAVHSDAEILLVDEVLAVGDQAFQSKCLERMEELRRAGRTIVCASHSSAVIERLCDRAIWLDHGELIMDGEVSRVLGAYQGRLVERRTAGE